MIKINLLNETLEMQRTTLRILAILMPCSVLFIRDNPIGGFFVFILQSSIVGWIPACFWAWHSIPKEPKKPKRAKTKNLAP